MTERRVQFFLAFSLLLCTATVSAQSVVRFVALGDAGEGNAAQFQVGAAMEQVCAVKGCDFALYLGDNFYDVGVDSFNDPQFQTKFEQPYADLDIPFLVTLGNHDYGATSLEWWKPWNQIFYSYVTGFAKFILPFPYYNLRVGHVELFAVDSHAVFLGWGLAQQSAWLSNALANSTAEWKIVFGHHTYISNGRHGNAGNYEGCPFCGFISGVNVKSFVEGAVCGQADYYFSGHDHDMQWLEPACGTGFIVSGAGSKTRTLVRRDANPTFFEEDGVEGFLWVEIRDNTLTGEFYDKFGNRLFSRSVSK